MDGEGGERPIDEAGARDLRARLPAGVTVVTTRLETELHGITVTAFCFVALRPALALACLEQPSRSAELIGESRVFAVNILSWQQMFLADRFAGRGPLVGPRFDGVPHRFAVTGSPILDGSVAWLDCRVTAARAAGDHTIFLGEIVAGDVSGGGEPLIYYDRRYARLR